MKDLFEQLSKLNSRELKEVNSMVIDLLKNKRKTDAIFIKRQMRPGQVVTFDNGKRTREDFEVISIEQTKFTGKSKKNGIVYKVPISAITHIDGREL